MTRRRIVYDITRLVSRIRDRTPNGIDRVDFALANHFIKADDPDRSGMMNMALGPSLLTPRAAREALDNIRKHWGEDEEPDSDPHYLEVAAALDGEAVSKRVSKGRSGQYREALAWVRRHGLPLGKSPRKFLADGGVYFNVSQFPLEFDRFFRWSADNPAIDNVFFLHDLLPLETPEYFLPAEYPRHRARMETVARRARAVIVSSCVVRDAVRRCLADLGRSDIPILVAPLPPDPIFLRRTTPPPAAGGAYFVACGTIEPRKNHLLLLHAWRDIVARLGAAAPKLVMIGERGWENEHVVDLLERCPGLRGHVIEASGLTTPSLKRLLLGARALLFPTFAEGYGLPLAEALAAGVPAIASDIPVFHEVGQMRALMIDPTDGPAWREAICAYAREGSPERQVGLERAARYTPPDEAAFFAAIEAFLLDLRR